MLRIYVVLAVVPPYLLTRTAGMELLMPAKHVIPALITVQQHVAARRIGRETVQYVSNVYKYYLAYRQLQDLEEAPNQNPIPNDIP